MTGRYSFTKFAFVNSFGGVALNARGKNWAGLKNCIVWFDRSLDVVFPMDVVKFAIMTFCAPEVKL